MSQHAETPPLTCSELGVSELLPTATVTLLLADVEGSTQLWETQPEQTTAALALLNRMVNQAIAAHDGVRPLEQGEGDSFVAAFARASDAVACAPERDAHDALSVAARLQAYLRVDDILEYLARLAADGDNHPHAVRLFGAADAIRLRSVASRVQLIQEAARPTRPRADAKAPETPCVRVLLRLLAEKP